ncbi:MAG: hypothetical protein JSS72_13390 [Armatimonadetes bacterium]|nr:hypothetical protein [Armatimonadota bacterium]
MKRLLFFSLLLTSPFAMSDDSPIPTVKLSAKGTDVRDVLCDLFTQAKKSFVLDPGIKYSLYLNLDSIPFDESLTIICKTANLSYEQQNGVYFVRRSGPAKTQPITAAAAPKPLGFLPESYFLKRVSLNLTKTALSDIMTELSHQTGAPIEIAKEVPAYRLDAVLGPRTLRSALLGLTNAAGLKFKATNNRTILIYKESDSDHVTVVDSSK